MSAIAPSVDDSRRLSALPVVLSTVAGSADTLSFLAMGGLFVAHITGNLIILAAHIVDRAQVGVGAALSVPVFVLALVFVRVLISPLETRGLSSLRPLLSTQLILLAGFTSLPLVDRHASPNSPATVAAAMLGVCAMAAQNALVKVSLREAPSTAVMTTNVTRFTMDVGEILVGRDRDALHAARTRATHTGPVILGFAAGATAAAASYAAVGAWSLVLPTGLAVVALALGWSSASTHVVPPVAGGGASDDGMITPQAHVERRHPPGAATSSTLSADRNPPG